MTNQTDPDEAEPTAALTSRSAVVAAVLLGLAIIVAAFAMYACEDRSPAGDEGSSADDASYVTTGSVAPDFTLTSLDGDTVSLSDYAGRPVLINFWASWCPPCRAEFPELAAAREAHAADGLEILGVTHNDGIEESRRFVVDSDAEWPILPDPDDEAWSAYGGVALPISYFVDAEGIVERVHIGPLNEDQISDHLAAIGVPG